mmetsp:Transcript_38259/g.57282  ORF Transcript_38259/g.57282 Transcript_38259/m.57282 type:complete len:94 (-) Transcript_38259:136-417(-)|eukprot:2531406-Ditylum_brightwellii.AAC.1
MKNPCKKHEVSFPIAINHPVSDGVIEAPTTGKKKERMMSKKLNPSIILWYESFRMPLRILFITSKIMLTDPYIDKVALNLKTTAAMISSFAVS